MYRKTPRIIDSSVHFVRREREHCQSHVENRIRHDHVHFITSLVIYASIYVFCVRDQTRTIIYKSSSAKCLYEVRLFAKIWKLARFWKLAGQEL